MNNGGLDLRTAGEVPLLESCVQATGMLLIAGGFGTYIAFLHPAVGIALLVGISVMTLLHLLLK